MRAIFQLCCFSSRFGDMSFCTDFSFCMCNFFKDIYIYIQLSLYIYIFDLLLVDTLVFNWLMRRAAQVSKSEEVNLSK